MTEYEALTKMGIQKPKEIVRYELYSVDQMDILRIIYDRKKGSFLPVTKKYRFPQLKRSTLVDSGTGQAQVIFESSAEVRNAVAELDRLMKGRKTSVAGKDALVNELVNELRLMEEEVNARIGHLKNLINQI